MLRPVIVARKDSLIASGTPSLIRSPRRKHFAPETFLSVFLMSLLVNQSLIYVDFAYFPLFLQVRYLNVHVLAVFSVTRTLCHTRGQTAVVGTSGFAQLADEITSIYFALRPRGLSNQHLDVGLGTNDVATCYRDRERHLDCFWDIHLDHESVLETFPLWLWSPTPGSG